MPGTVLHASCESSHSLVLTLSVGLVIPIFQTWKLRSSDDGDSVSGPRSLSTRAGI